VKDKDQVSYYILVFLVLFVSTKQKEKRIYSSSDNNCRW